MEYIAIGIFIVGGLMALLSKDPRMAASASTIAFIVLLLARR